MTLLDTRDRFLEAAGRTDIGTPSTAATDGSDGTVPGLKANDYINAAHRYLDDLGVNPSSIQRRQWDLVVGDSFKTFTSCISILSFSLIKSDARAWPAKVDLDDLKATFPKTVATTTNSTPKYWSPARIFLSPEQQDLTSATYSAEFTYDFEDIDFGAPDGTKGIVFFPPTDFAWTGKIIGRFHSPVLAVNADTSYWTETYPDILVMAAMLKLEQTYRNSEGVADWKRSIEDALLGIWGNSIEEGMSEAVYQEDNNG